MIKESLRIKQIMKVVQDQWKTALKEMMSPPSKYLYFPND